MLQHLKHPLREDWKLTGQSRFAKQAKTSLSEGNELEWFQVRLCEGFMIYDSEGKYTIVDTVVHCLQRILFLTDW